MNVLGQNKASVSGELPGDIYVDGAAGLLAQICVIVFKRVNPGQRQIFVKWEEECEHSKHTWRRSNRVRPHPAQVFKETAGNVGSQTFRFFKK